MNKLQTKFISGCLALWLCLGSLPLVAQPGANLEKIQETLRFVRLAETRKNLSFSDEKLLTLNEILDEFESNQLKLKHKERRVKVQLREGLADKSQLIDEFLQIKGEVHQNEMTMWTEVRKLLTPDETIEFFSFYSEFQRKVQQRARQLNRPPHHRRQGPNRFRN